MKCDKRIYSDAWSRGHSCGRKVVEGETKCSIHTDAAQAARNAKSNARFAAKMRMDEVARLRSAAAIIRQHGGDPNAAAECDRLSDELRGGKS
jgi:phosphohistidine swiveling domain-containing protein